MEIGELNFVLRRWVARVKRTFKTSQATICSEVEAKHSEVLKGTQSTISCVVTGLTKALDTVVWEKPSSGGAITNNVEDYKIEVGTYQESSHSQTTILTVPAAANSADAVFTCVVTSDEHKKTAHKTDVKSNVFSECFPYFI